MAHARSLGVSGDVVREVLGYAKELAERLRLSPKLELENVVRALSGEYIPPGVGGDYVLDPDVLPAGRNLYALDPLKIPSESALELGARMAEESVRRYLNQSGRYLRRLVSSCGVGRRLGLEASPLGRHCAT